MSVHDDERNLRLQILLLSLIRGKKITYGLWVYYWRKFIDDGFILGPGQHLFSLQSAECLKRLIY